MQPSALWSIVKAWSICAFIWSDALPGDGVQPSKHSICSRSPLKIQKYGYMHYNDVPNGRDDVSNHQSHHCLLFDLFRCRSKKTSKLRVTGLCEGNSPVTGEFPAQRASSAEKCFHLITTSWVTQFSTDPWWGDSNGCQWIPPTKGQ